MNLADMLCYADIDQLTRIARTYDCLSSSHSKNELIQSILTVISRQEALESRMGELGEEDLRFLNSLLFENREVYSMEELKARALGNGLAASAEATPPAAPHAEESAKAPRKRGRGKAAAGSEPPPTPEDAARQTILRFKRYGWLFNGFSQHTRYLYQVPEDVKRRVSATLERQFRQRLEESGEPGVYRDESGLLAEDVGVFLRYVRDHDVPLTSDGILYKRQLGQALELLAVAEPLPVKGGWRFGYGRHFRDYPDRFSLLYDFAYFEGLLREQSDRLVLTEEGRDTADGQRAIDPARLYKFWLRLYKGPIPNLAALVQWVSRLSASWVTASSLFAILRPLIRSYYYDQEKDILDRRVLGMMMHLGLLRLGESDAGEAVVRMTPHGRATVSGVATAFEDIVTL